MLSPITIFGTKFLFFDISLQMMFDAWYLCLMQVKKKRPGRDGKMAGLVPVLYVSQS